MRIKVKVIPRSAAVSVSHLGGNSYKVKVTAPPAENKANLAVIKVLARYFKTARSGIRLVKGRKSRQKILEIDAR